MILYIHNEFILLLHITCTNFPYLRASYYFSTSCLDPCLITKFSIYLCSLSYTLSAQMDINLPKITNLRGTQKSRNIIEGLRLKIMRAFSRIKNKNLPIKRLWYFASVTRRVLFRHPVHEKNLNELLFLTRWHRCQRRYHPSVRLELPSYVTSGSLRAAVSSQTNRIPGSYPRPICRIFS